MSKNQYKKFKNRIRRQKLCVIFNYSSIKLTEPMNRVLNRGLNFSILPLKLDITQILVDFKRYERTMIWQEFWHNQDSDKNQQLPLFES